MAKYKVEVSYKVKDHTFDTITHVDAPNRDAAIEKVKSHFTSMRATNINIKHATAETK